ncbi:28S ribosomal protein S34, mitochondrial [Octopus bimaculoides]|uniref:28S ribosomal protein S34, mitochondrial n=1 Tax=Octopus bimaculoides TaxID=37653 RepID=A0A0L8HXF4_OCTBM|nr:28S ribosomal protein S34, mitochondrial [Octopus bimaculoides]|eukprot:XP_014768609.1 PREDICTED: 28S ribosomal protein S34, mitochondrial-like [Octopus bimaculoides]
MRVVRRIGRVNLDWSGRNLFSIVTNLKNNGVGRVVVRHSFLNRYPEKSYYRLTEVQPNFCDGKRRTGKAWGIKVFRGKEFPRPCGIDACHKADWKLIPKEEEEEFCKLTATDVRETQTVPLSMEFPPLLKAMILAKKTENGESLPEDLRLKLTINKGPFSTEVKQQDKHP